VAVQSTSVGRRVASNTALQLLSKGAVLVMGAASITVLTRYLGPDRYGRYTFALLYMQLFGVLADVGLFTTAVREISKAPERADELVANTLALRLLLSLVVIAAGAGISLLLPYRHDVRLAILLAGGPLLFGMLTGSVEPVFQAQLRMGRAASAEVIGRAVALALAVLVAVLDLGFYAVIGAAAGGALATLIVTWALSRRLIKLRLRVQREVWRALLAASLPLGLALAINQVYVRADTLIISLSRPYTQVGFYTLAYRILDLVLVFGTVFLNTTLPVTTRMLRDDPARARRVIQVSTDVLALAGIPLAAGGLVLAPAIVHAAGGHRFAGAATPLRLLLFAGALMWINGVFGFALIARERQASALWLNVAGLVFNVVLNVILIPRYGIAAAASVTIASEVLLLAGSYWLMRRYVGFFPSLRTLVPAAAAAVLMALVVGALSSLPWPVRVLIGAALYCAMVWAISPSARQLVDRLRS
jgi:O-antigen/teichoic acid export membrane protein